MILKLTIDGSAVEIPQGGSIFDALLAGGFDTDTLKTRPLAAKIGGEVFSLRFRPNKPVVISLLRYSDEEGRRVYERSLQFILVMAVRNLFPGARVQVRYTLGPGLYVTINKTPELSREDVLALEGECRRIVRLDLPFDRRRLNIDEALEYFTRDGQLDKAKLLAWRKFSWFDVYCCESYCDYFYGEMVPSSGYVDVFRMEHLDGAIEMLLPMPTAPDVPAAFMPMPKIAGVYRQSDEWGALMTCSTANELNTHVQNGTIRELIRVNEALHEKSYAAIADNIVTRKSRAVMVAGPSSSGKTTSAHRIATQLRVLGQSPVMLSLDNYYLDRDKIAPDEDGKLDLEHINTLDIARFNEDLALLLQGEEVELPLFSFKTGKREERGTVLRVHKDEPLIIEGIHGLNPLLIGDSIDHDAIYRVYVSALTTMNLDDHNRLRTTDVRLLRRLVRDFNTRGASMEHTLSMWSSVRRGEETWIFPYQEYADSLFNTTLVYELAVMKKYVYPLLQAVEPDSPFYINARSIVKFLNYFLEADVEDEIPPTSILREFIGGNTFYKE